LKMIKAKTRLIITLAAMLAAVAVLLIGANYSLNKKIEVIPTVLLNESGIDMNDKSIRLIAQGGLSGAAPVNTYIAVEKAAREGFTAIEIDVRETRDGVWVLMKDSTINKMTDGRGRISQYTFFDLLNYTVDNGANIDEYPDTKIAELEDILILCAMYNVRPYIRVEQSSQAGLAKLAGLFSAGSETQIFALLSSDTELLQSFKELTPKTELWFTADRLSAGKIRWLEANKDIGFIFDAGKKANTDEKIKQVLDAGIKTAAWNADYIQTIGYLYNIGVKNFYTSSVLPK